MNMNEVDKDIEALANFRGFFNGLIIAIGAVIWILSVMAEDVYLGEYLMGLQLPAWAASWLVPFIMFLIPVLGIFVPVIILLVRAGKIGGININRVPAFKLLIDIVVLASTVVLLVSPLFLGIFVMTVLSRTSQIIILAGALLITMILILRSAGILRWSRHYFRSLVCRK